MKTIQERTIKALSWMTDQLKWQFRQTENIDDSVPDCDVNWSPEMRDAMEILSELQKGGE